MGCPLATLITGAGLIGTAFAKVAVERGETPIFLDSQRRESFVRLQLGRDASYELVEADVRDLPALVQIMRTRSVDVVVHTAGLIGKRVAESLYSAFQVNVQGSTNVAEAVRQAEVRRLVHVSSFGVYDRRRTADAPVTESFARGNGGAYSNLNVAKEVILEAYARRFGFELVVLRPACVFGLGHFWSGSGGGKKIQDLVIGGLTGEQVRIRSEDAATNEYIYAKDLGRAIDRAAVVTLPRQSFINVGSGGLTTVGALIGAAKELMPGLEVVIESGDATQGKTAHLDISAAKRLLGWDPAYSLKAALADYVRDVQRLGLGHLDLLQS